MYKIDEIKMLRLGQRDENLARTIPMDASEWLELYPGASIQILFRRPGESTITPMVSTLIDGVLTWQIHDFEVGKTGVGNAEIRAVDTAGLRRKSRIIPCSIEDTLLGDDETVLYTQDQVDITLAHIGEAAQAALAAKASEDAAALSAQEAADAAGSIGTAVDAAVSARDAAQAAQTAAETAQHQAEAAESGVHADAEAAEQAKVAAQAAQASAQGAASQASADRTAAETARADAEAAAEHAQAVTDGIDQAGADQVAAVNAAGATQVGNVNAAGTTQVNAVQAKGAQVIASIPADYSDLTSTLNNTSQVVYKTDISATTGLIPFHAKNGDSVTIKTKDGSNFADNDQLRFYDADGVLITYWSTAPQTVNFRTITYNQASEAFYIGITQVAQSVITYIVDNSNNAYNLEKPIANLQSEIKYQETKKLKLESGTFTDATGTEKTANSARCRNVAPIPLADLVSISMPDGYSMYIFLLDYNLQKIGVLTWSTYRTKSDFGNAFYINIGIRNTSSPSTSIVDHVSTIESGIVIRSDFNQLKEQVDNINDDLYEQTVLLSDTSLHPFPVSNGTDIVITTADETTLPEGNPYLQCYDSEGTYITQYLCSSDYGTARTVTVSSGNISFVKMYAVPSKTIKVYIPDNNKLIPKVNEIAKAVGQDTIIVDASGAGDYTSFTQAIYETVDSGRDVYVKPGTYDIVAEYIALFGQSAVDSMADSDSAIFNGFQYGVRLRKRRVEFAPGAHLVCDWTGHTVDGTHRFSALGVDYNVEIIGLDIDVTATFYCIHDDYGIATPYTVKYENCRVVGHNITNANCIGGGCKKYSRHILNNCYFDNNLTGSATVRYHNTNAEGAEPEIFVSNCYFNNWFTPRWYGAQTSKMRVYVNNCHARAIYKIAESSSYDVDNVELYKWNNEETNPRT